jgi:hypothetical protein
MSGEGPPGRRGASLLSILASSALAALAVLVLVGVLILAFGRDDSTDQAGVTDPTPLAVTAVPGSSATPRATPVVVPSVLPSPTPSPTPDVPVGVKAPVIVLNQTKTLGLAAKLRDQLRAGGWTVTGIDDFRGNVPATTVYYPPGLKAAAQALMAQFPTIGRIRPAFPGISTSQLTVILGKDFPTTG